MNTRCFGQSLLVLYCPASGQPGFSHTACMLWIADTVTACNTYRYLLSTLPEVETVVLWIAVSCFCLYRYMCVGTYEEQRNNFSCHSSDDNYFLLFCACVWCMHVRVLLCELVSLPTAQLCLLFILKHLATCGFSALHSSCSAIAVPLLSLSLLHCLLFFSFSTEPEKAKEKLLEKSLFWV